MRTATTTAAALVPALLLSACVTTTTQTSTWSDPSAGEWARSGHVESIRETVQRQEGNPAAGAVAGALFGALLGSTFGGHTYYDRWGYGHHHGSEAGALVGAVGGAVVGAAASQGTAESRTYDVFVRFDDGALQAFRFGGYPPFQPGQPVQLTPRGLIPAE
jgi:outer membrane lipoprotein SlyB